MHNLLGFIPALIFPLATFLQLFKILRDQAVSGVSAPSWFLFGLANLALYGYVEKYAEPQAICSMLVTGVLNLAIALTVLYLRQAQRNTLI